MLAELCRGFLRMLRSRGSIAESELSRLRQRHILDDLEGGGPEVHVHLHAERALLVDHRHAPYHRAVHLVPLSIRCELAAFLLDQTRCPELPQFPVAAREWYVEHECKLPGATGLVARGCKDVHVVFVCEYLRDTPLLSVRCDAQFGSRSNPLVRGELELIPVPCPGVLFCQY